MVQQAAEVFDFDGGPGVAEGFVFGVLVAGAQLVEDAGDGDTGLLAGNEGVAERVIGKVVDGEGDVAVGGVDFADELGQGVVGGGEVGFEGETGVGEGVGCWFWQCRRDRW